MSLDRTKHSLHALLIPLGLSVVLAAPPAIATQLDPVSRDELVQRSQLVFHGIVTTVEHRSSEVVQPGDPVLPHTFVTFQVEDVLKGSTGSSITLRFQGGPDGNGLFLQVSGVPTFAIGDRALLFVQDTSAPICPLVGGEQGVVRLRDGRAVTDLGIDLGAESDELASVRESVHRLHTPAELASLPFVRGNSILERLRVSIGAEMPPPADVDPLAPENADLLEADLMGRNGGDPVLPVR